MASRSRDDEPKPRPTTVADKPEAPTGAPSLEPTGVGRPVAGGISRPLSGRLPVGGITGTLAGEADATGDMLAAAPSFGQVLRSIGDAVVQSQTELDAGVVETVQALDDAKIEVVTDVIQELDDDGLPSAESTQLVIQEISALNFVTPTVHEWKHVAVSMDLEVGAVDRETGMTFKHEQRDISYHAYGLFWGFLGWFDMNDSTKTTTTTRTTDQESAWSRGQVRLDARLAPRRTTKFPVPAEVTVGPTIYFAQGGSTEADDGDTVKRSVEMTITVRKADGTPNPSKTLGVDAGTLQVEFIDDAVFGGATTNAQGQVRVNLVRSIPNVFFQRSVRRRVTATLGQLTQSTSVVI